MGLRQDNMKKITAAFLIVSLIIAGTAMADNVKVLKVDIQTGMETEVFEFKPEDFEEIEVVRHGLSRAPNNFEARGILSGAKKKSWIGFCDGHQGSSIKTLIGDEIAQDSHIILGDLEYVPLGFSTGQEAKRKAAKVSGAPKYIDDMQKEEAAADKKRKKEVEKAVKRSKGSQDEEGFVTMGGTPQTTVSAP